jgi:hypothetical protein
MALLRANDNMPKERKPKGPRILAVMARQRREAIEAEQRESEWQRYAAAMTACGKIAEWQLPLPLDGREPR